MESKVQEIPFFIPMITEDDIKAVLETLKSRWLTGGPKAVEFEKVFAGYVGTKFAVSVNSCTAALHLAMRALNVGPGDEVILPVLTFAATANAPLFCGAKPIFADIDEKTFNVSPEALMEKITGKTKAIIVVHYGGQPCDMKEILQIAEDSGLQVVEDCAHSLGAKYRGRQTGSFGTMGCFSFYPTKNMTTLEGGMITTDKKEIAERVRRLREHGVSKVAFDREQEASWYYDVIDLGYNYRLNEVQAALGISQLKRLDEMNNKKIKNAQYLTKHLKKIKGIITPFTAKDREHVYHLYVIRVIQKEFELERNALFIKLSRQGIGLSVHYTPLHLLSFYRRILQHKPRDFPVAENLYKEILTLPMYHQLTENQMNYIIECISKANLLDDVNGRFQS